MSARSRRISTVLRTEPAYPGIRSGDCAGEDALRQSNAHLVGRNASTIGRRGLRLSEPHNDSGRVPYTDAPSSTTAPNAALAAEVAPSCPNGLPAQNSIPRKIRMSIDEAFNDTHGKPGLNLTDSDWPHGGKGSGIPHGAIFSRSSSGGNPLRWRTGFTIQNRFTKSHAPVG